MKLISNCHLAITLGILSSYLEVNAVYCTPVVQKLHKSKLLLKITPELQPYCSGCESELEYSASTIFQYAT